MMLNLNKNSFIPGLVLAGLLVSLPVLGQDTESGQRHKGGLEALDSNGDGSLNYEEFSAREDRRFMDMDTDGDGAVSLSEYQESLFLRLDRNGDGLLTPGEMRPRRHPGSGFPGLRERREERRDRQAQQ